jgi:hypothetical protein
MNLRSLANSLNYGVRTSIRVMLLVVLVVLACIISFPFPQDGASQYSSTLPILSPAIV